MLIRSADRQPPGAHPSIRQGFDLFEDRGHSFGTTIKEITIEIRVIQILER